MDWAKYFSELSQGNTNTRPANALVAAKDAQAAALQSAYDQNIAQYNAQAQQVPQAYQQYRNQASENAAIQQRVINEYLANKGYSGAGGQSLTFRQRNNNNLNNQIGMYNQQQQQTLDAINLAKSGLGSQFQSDLATSGADYDMRIADMMYQQEQNNYSKAMQLYSAGLITAAQFEAMTGINIKTRSSRSPKKVTADDLYNDLIAMGISPIEAANEANGYNGTTIKPVVSHNAYYDPTTGRVYGMQGSIAALTPKTTTVEEDE